jgi:hypothetical protein
LEELGQVEALDEIPDGAGRMVGRQELVEAAGVEAALEALRAYLALA